MDHKIIVIDDDPDFIEIISSSLRSFGFKSIAAGVDPLAAVDSIEKGDIFDVALIDMTMPDMDGLEVLEIVKRNSPGTECIMVTAVNQARVAVECMKKGAYDYLVKPIAPENLLLVLQRALERKRLLDLLDIGKSKKLPKLAHKEAFQSIVTRSHNVLRVLKEAELHAASDVPILIFGESGTGKELLAQAIHTISPRSAFAFTPVNMAALTGSLFDAEFFGHSRGAFTGAEKDRAGYLEYSNHGTLFLDEIGNLPLELQGKLLRVLQDGEYTKLGTSRKQYADVRFIAATNVDLEKLMANRMFRKDLYYRIRGGWLHLPPLKERTEDIPLLIQTFVQEYSDRFPSCNVAEEALNLLANYHYPGNIRELRSIIRSAMNLSRGRTITADFLPAHIKRPTPGPRATDVAGTGSIAPLAEVEKNHIVRAYLSTGKNKSLTAKILGIGLNTLRRKLNAFEVEG
ncbi:MAG: sigma-54 dependent transcriptional regulator [Desulfobacterales bacterium]|nr:sigma-54 dependent transcriptional regulator [Desulfobacterales bacterium]